MPQTATAPVLEYHSVGYQRVEFRGVEYPESDGRPMGETDVHRDEMANSIYTLADFFRDDPEVYVTGNIFMYYIEGQPSKSVAPDVMVVSGVAKRKRRTYKLWLEGKVPNLVIEVSSLSTKKEDKEVKKVLYARLGVGEYYLFDPMGEYQTPKLQGLVLRKGGYRSIPPNPDGSLTSFFLGLRLEVIGDNLHFVDPVTGKRLLCTAKARERARTEAAAREVAEAAARKEAGAREVAEAATRKEAGAREVAEAAARKEAGAREVAEAATRKEAAARKAAEERAAQAREEMARMADELARLRDAARG